MAVQRLHDTSTNYRKAKPSSLVVLDTQADQLCYGEGILIYGCGMTFRILDVYNASQTEEVIDIIGLIAYIAKSQPDYAKEFEEIIQPRLSRSCGCSSCNRVRIGRHAFRACVLWHGHGIVCVEIRAQHPPTYYCIAMDMTPNIRTKDRMRYVGRRSETATVKMRTDGRYLLYAEYSFSWGLTVRCFDLQEQQYTLPEFCLRYFPSIKVEYGPDRYYYPRMDFRCFDRHFYILGDRHETEQDGNYDSAYYCYRWLTSDSHPEEAWRAKPSVCGCPVNLPPESLEIVRILRPKLEDDPQGSDDAPVTLELHQDKDTGLLNIVELRRDPVKGEFYCIQPFSFPKVSPRTLKEPDTTILDIVQTLGNEDLPRPTLYSCPQMPQSFAKSADLGFRRFMLGKKAFVDGMFMPFGPTASKTGYGPALAIGSPKIVIPTDQESSQLNALHCLADKHNFNFKEDGLTIYRFPSKRLPQRLLEFLAPASRIQAYSWHTANDSRTCIFVSHFVDSSDKLETRVTLVNFDPGIRFTGLEAIEVSEVSDQLSSRDYKEDLSNINQVYREEWFERMFKALAKAGLLIQHGIPRPLDDPEYDSSNATTEDSGRSDEGQEDSSRLDSNNASIVRSDKQKEDDSKSDLKTVSEKESNEDEDPPIILSREKIEPATPVDLNNAEENWWTTGEARWIRIGQGFKLQPTSNSTKAHENEAWPRSTEL